MITGSSMQAMTLAVPPQTRHVSTSILKTRFSRCAQVIAMDGVYAGFAGAKTGHGRMTLNWRLLLLALGTFGLATLAPLRQCHQRTVLAVRGEYTVKSSEIDSRLRHQGGQATDSDSTNRKPISARLDLMFFSIRY